nr:hypothetical protein [Tanacetum cinerariifolium]
MMIDFALEGRQHLRLDARAAIHRAALLRLRPILMTTLAALFGALPLMLATGAGAELRRPLGLVIVGGLLLSQLLPVAPLPQVDFPTIMVSASLPGASPETMAATVATPLER